MIEQVPNSQLKDLLVEFFSKDQNYVDNLHIEAGKGLDACVDYNVKALKDLEHVVYRLGDKGFFCLADDVYLRPNINLNLFFISPENRKDGTKETMVELAKEKAGDRGLASIVVGKNTPIVNFYKKFGIVDLELEDDKNTYIIIRFTR